MAKYFIGVMFDPIFDSIQGEPVPLFKGIILTFYYHKSTQKAGKLDTHIEDPHLKYLLDHNPLRNHIPYYRDEINPQITFFYITYF